MWDKWRIALTPELQKRDITIEVGGHGYENFIEPEMENGKLFEMHPEWFGVDDAGYRDRGYRVFCTSNDDAVKYLASNLVKYVQARPEIQIFDFWPTDGAPWCRCEICEAQGTPADRQAILLNKVTAEVAKVRPDLRMECIAYAHALAPPSNAVIDESVLIDYCPIAQCFDKQIDDLTSELNAMYTANLKAWREAFKGDINLYSYYRKYMWNSKPVIIPNYMQKDLRFYRTIPIRGMQIYTEPGDWFTFELNYYVLSHLLWDIESDVDTLIKDFCRHRYGTASGAAVKAFTILEDNVRRYSSIPHIPDQSADERSKAIGRLEDAARTLRNTREWITDETIRYNIDRMLLTIKYAQLDIDIIMGRDSGVDPSVLRDKVHELHEFLKRHKRDGVFVESGDYPFKLAIYRIKTD